MADPAATGNKALRKVVFVSIYLEENAEAPLLSDLPQNRTWDDRVSAGGFRRALTAGRRAGVLQPGDQRSPP